jgi:hypothetical protein
VFAAVGAGAQESPAALGILPRLTVETYDEAKACGRAGFKCATEPYLICPSANAMYTVRLATPFSRVASAVAENLKSGRSGRGMERGNANRWGSGLYVLPAERSPSARAIEQVEIRREGRTIQPLTTTVGPIAVPMPDGSSKQLARGYFAFAPEAFLPTADLTIILTGPDGVTQCIVERARLQELR